MNRSRNYTFISLVLAVLFLVGSMAYLNYIFQVRERQLLSEQGETIVESPVRSWQEDRDGKLLKSEKSDENRYMLSDEQMEDAINSWNNRDGEIIHDPVEGQVSMQEAIKVGENWLIQMGMIVGEGQEVEEIIYSVNALLSVGVENKSTNKKLDPYYSFWTVQLSGQNLNAVLYLNAVTGSVWSAEITLYDNMPDKIQEEKIELFIGLAGLQAANVNTLKMNEKKTQGILAVKNSEFYAQMRYYTVNRNGDTLVDYRNLETVQDHYVVINFDLMVNEE